uniref:Uncharacterized protein n=1 Tax=Rhizophora mucronata TaxID=61149 RepID=A0A2P2IS94_RHIMU
MNQTNNFFRSSSALLYVISSFHLLSICLWTIYLSL